LNSRLAIACGDPAGVGPEVIAAWMGAPGTERALLTAIGPARWLETLPPDVKRMPVGDAGYAAVPGKPDGHSARVAWEALERAATLCAQGGAAGAVTGPVSKERLAAIGWTFPGQTEFFAARWGGVPTMAFTGGRLRVALATWHVPLRAVPDLLTPEALERAVAAADQLARADGVMAPRIGVCGLNPHAGEGGLIGTEERDRIDPVLDALRPGYPGLSRCQPADTLFGRQLQGEFDCSVALYHDQGLAPLKVIDFDLAVNVTLGLPYVRTSPDHGTAFGLAGRGEARWQSFGNAVAVARRLLQARDER